MNPTDDARGALMPPDLILPEDQALADRLRAGGVPESRIFAATQPSRRRPPLELAEHETARAGRVPSMLFFGHAGSGKSGIACSLLVRALRAGRARTFAWVGGADLAASDSWRRDDLLGLDVVVLDGVEAWLEQRERLGSRAATVIVAREDARRPTLVTSTLGPDAFARLTSGSALMRCFWIKCLRHRRAPGVW